MTNTTDELTKNKRLYEALRDCAQAATSLASLCLEVMKVKNGDYFKNSPTVDDYLDNVLRLSNAIGDINKNPIFGKNLINQIFN